MTKRTRGFLWRLMNNEGFAGPKEDDKVDDDTALDLDDDTGSDDSSKKDDDTAEDLEDDEGDSKNDDGSLTIDLDDEAAKKNKAWAAMRAENKRLKEENERIQQMVKQSQTQYQQMPAPTPAPVQDNRPKFRGVSIPQTDQEWDALAKQNWKLAVDMRAHMQAEEITQRTTQLSRDGELLEKSKSRVIERHPELNDPSSEKTQVYLRILQENPRYLNDPKGPIHAMRDMEDYMVDVLGYQPDEIRKARKEASDRERQRQQRAGLASSTGRTAMKSGNTVTLSKEDLEFCKYHGIDPKDFAKNKKKVSKSGTGGIQV